MLTDDLKRILKEFCGKDHLLRFDSTNPFIRDGNMIATDGNIMVLVPVKGEDSTPRVLPFPSIEKALEVATHIDPVNEWPHSFDAEFENVDFQDREVTELMGTRFLTEYLRKISNHVPGSLVFGVGESMLVAVNEYGWLIVLMGIAE